ncbi:unnamed protein product [Tenebrio molitor]|nr:unnamed protein product [Tenebrio molitor]
MYYIGIGIIHSFIKSLLYQFYHPHNVKKIYKVFRHKLMKVLKIFHVLRYSNLNSNLTIIVNS